MRKSEVATTNLIKTCENLNSYILFLQEPRTIYKKVSVGQNTKLHYESHKHVRAALGHSPDLNILGIPTLTDRDIVTCQWQKSNPDQTVILISAYWDITSPVIPTKLESALLYAHNKNLQVILCIDTNAHSTTWGSPNDNSRGLTFEELVTNHNLAIQNIGTNPTFQTFREGRSIQSIIDLTITSELHTNIIHDWTISNSFVGSDHKLIHFTIFNRKEPMQRSYNFSKCNWPKFKNDLEYGWEEQPLSWNQESIDKEALIIQYRLKSALDTHCPKTNIHKNRKITWWSDELQKLKKKVRVSHHKLTDNPSDVNQEDHKKLYNEYKKLIRQSKRQHFCRLTTEIQNPKDLAKLHKNLQNKHNNKHLGMVKKPDGSLTETIDDMANTLLNTHFPNNSSYERPMPNTNTTIAPNHTWINLKTIKQAISNFKNDKAAGPDLIKPIVLKNIPDNVLLRLCTLYSASIETGYTPKIWRSAKIIFIPKPGKNDYTDPNAFRPISLTSFMLKTLERLVLWRLEDTTFKRFPLHKNQHAFRRGHSTEIPLSKLTNFVETAFINKEYAVGIFLDIIGAFNNVTHEAIIKAMKDNHFPQEIINWYGNYTQSRLCMIVIGNKTYIRHLKDGTSQGGILSPVIFNLVINVLLLIIEKAKELGIAFADDTMCGSRGRCLQTILNKLQKLLDELTYALNQTGMKFSPDKTQVVIFSRKKVDTTNLIKLKMYNQDINFSDTVKYLGVTFDSKLTFKQHISNAFNKAKRIMFSAKAIMGKFWGPSPILTKWLYTNVVRPTFTYGCIAWGHTTRSKTFMKKAKRLQRLGLKSLGPIRTHSPTSGLEVVTYTPPLETFIKGEIIAAYNRTRTKFEDNTIPNTTDTIASHLAWAKQLSQEAEIYNIPKDQTDPFFHGSRKWEVNLNEYNPYNEMATNKLQIYTDGSHMKLPDSSGITGCGYVIIELEIHTGEHKPIHNHKQYLGKMTTIFQAEVYAILLACEYITNNINSYNKIKCIDIVSDSKAALQALQKNVTTSYLVKQCKHSLDNLSNLVKTELHWIKAHVGHFGNEIADKNAKSGANQPNYLVEPILPVAKSWIGNKIKKYIHTEWTKAWRALPEARQTKLFFPTPHRLKTKKLMNYNRESFAELFRWISGHSFHRYHNSLTRPLEFPDPTCRACGIHIEETSHLFAECPNLSQTRYKILGHHILPENYNWTPDKLQEMIREISKKYPEESPYPRQFNTSQPLP
jgi:ribonuclease HI